MMQSIDLVSNIILKRTDGENQFMKTTFFTEIKCVLTSNLQISANLETNVFMHTVNMSWNTIHANIRLENAVQKCMIETSIAAGLRMMTT